MTDAPKQYRYKPLFEIMSYDSNTGYYRLYNQDDDINKSIMKEVFERDYEPVPAEQAEGGWISVADRLPEDMKPVMLTLDSELQIVGMGYTFSGEDVRQWHFQNVGMSSYGGIPDVTHWKELPKPPAREE